MFGRVPWNRKDGIPRYPNGKPKYRKPGTAMRGTSECSQKLSQAQRGCKKPGISESNREKPRRFTGGKDKYCRREAKLRDDHTCQICGHREPEIMEVDHIKPKSEFPELRFVLENLVTLCPNCHRRKTIREHKSRVPWNKKAA